GDAVLRQLGGLIMSHVRRDDVVARVGGEEFGVITPEIGAEGAYELANKLNRLVDDARFIFEGVRIEVTISAGVAAWTSELTSVEAMVQAADERLYEAKGSGRNRVC
ncbi:MAG: GGDEF domain-containing protein, partial [Myxococcota bacterium]